MSITIGPKQAVYPLDTMISRHSWPTYNLSGKYKLTAAEKKLYGTFSNGLWSYGSQMLNPESVNSGAVKITWGYNPAYSDWHGAVDITPDRSSRPIKVYAILGGTVVRKKGLSTGYCSVWVESIWNSKSIIWVYQHLHNKGLPALGKVFATGDTIGQVGYLTSSNGADMSHLHLECISKSLLVVPENMKVVCDSTTKLRSQFDYDDLIAIGITGKHYMYNGLYVIDFINGLA